MNKCLIIFLAAGVSGFGTMAWGGEGSQATFKERVDAFFLSEAGRPLMRAAKQPPLQEGRGNYTRAYSFSIVSFAARCFHLNERIDEANAALVENAQHYLDHPRDIMDRDSFHWHADIVMRLISMYGTSGTAQAGLLTPETEEICLKPIWIYVEKSSKYNQPDHDKTKTWTFHSTENHHSMDFSVQWHFAKLAKDRPEYRDRKVGGGVSLEDYYEEWNDYIVVYCRERAKKGVAIEIMCPGYNNVWLKGLYNFRDFGKPEVRHAVHQFLDLYWACWAQEQLNGVEGGGKTRIRGVNGFRHGTHGIPALGWLYFGIGEQPEKFTSEISAMLSDYEPPGIVARIAHGARERGPYEIRQRAQGLGRQGVGLAIPSDKMKPNEFRTDGGGIIRYSYCDPAFTIGCLMHEARPLEDWVHISAQSRWQGVIFSDHPQARIVPAVRPSGRARDVLNGQWSVQSAGCLITQKIPGNRMGGAMIVWMPKEGMAPPRREGDIVYVETKGAYVAIRVVGSDFRIADEEVSNESLGGSTRTAPPGNMIVPDDDFAPVILEVVARNRVGDFDAFKQQVRAAELEMQGSVLCYESVYGDRMTLDTQHRQVPTINGRPVDYSPPMVHESPFLMSNYDSGVVTIRYGNETKVLDFR